MTKMQLKKMVVGMLATVLLGGVTSTLIPTTVNAKAVPKFNSRYWFHNRKMRVKKTTVAYKIKVRYPLYRSTSVQKKTLHRGTKITVRNGGASWYWVVKGTGMHNSNNYFWVTNRNNSSWLKY